MDSYDSIEYCVWNEVPEERCCESCSLSHYGLDCHNNPIRCKDTEE